jgi:hypothetical protein
MDINRYNYETFFLLYLDGELSPAEMQTVERFLAGNADLQKEFNLLQQTIQLPADIIFERKETLFRKEEKRRIIPLYWMRIAAAVAVLVAGSLFISTQVLKNHTGDKPGNGGMATSAGVKAVPAKSNTGAEMGDKGNPAAQTLAIVNNHPADQPVESGRRENKLKSKTSPPDNTVKPSGLSDPDLQNQKVAAVKNNQSVQNPPINPEPGENGIARQKSNETLELEAAGMQNLRETEKMAALPVTAAPPLVLTTANTELQNSNEMAVLYDSGFQTDNAISVVALNDKNKNITGFFKKLTRRIPVDDGTKKLRVSVFQISL